MKSLLADPQTCGGLLVARAPHARDNVIAVFRIEEFGSAALTGEHAGGHGMTVEA